MHTNHLARILDQFTFHFLEGEAGGGGGGGNGNEPPEGGAAEKGKGAGTGDDGSKDLSSLSPEELVDVVRGLRRENAGHRTKVKELEPLAQKAKDLEEAGKSDVQKLTDEVSTLKTEVEPLKLENARLRVALDKGLTATQARRLVGKTVEELAADADELLKDMGGGSAGDGKSVPSRRPTEKLRPGGSNAGEDDPDEMDPKKLAEQIQRRS